MAKSVRYKLHKEKKRLKRTKVRKGKKISKGNKKKKEFPFFKVFKISLVTVLFLSFSYWFFIAYTTVANVKIQDVIGQTNEVVNFAEETKVRKTLIVYEDFTATEKKNLFILAVIYNSDTSEALIYYFPPELYIKDYFAKKDISVQNLTYAGERYMYEEKYGYVVRQIEEQMSINFDSYIWFGSEVGKNFVSDSDRWGYNKEDVVKLFSKLSFFNLIPKYYKVNLFYDYLHSNMNFFESYTYFQSMRGVILSGNYKYVDLGSENMTKSVVLGRGEKVRSLNLFEFDKNLKSNIDVLQTRALAREHVKVEVYNGSDIPMRARIVARRIQNGGCNVIRYENAAKPYEETYIYVTNREKFANGLKIVETIIGNGVVIEGRPEFMTTGDIVVVLGEQE